MKNACILSASLLALTAGVLGAQSRQGEEPDWPTPDVEPISITCEECPYPYPSEYLPLTMYGQELRMAYMDVAPRGPANGRTVVLLHGNNFAGFYFGNIAEALREEGFRVIIPDQMGYGRSSKPIIPYSFNDFARNTRSVLETEGIERAMIVGHSMGGMLAARFATQYPEVTEKLVIYNPIGLSDGRFRRPAQAVDDGYRRALESADFQNIKSGLMRYVAHDPSAWNEAFETYAEVRYGWTLGAEWPRLAMVQTIIGNLNYADPVVYDWPHIQAPTLVFGGAEDYLAGTPENFQARMRYVAETIPDGRARLHLLPGLGHVPHLEDEDRTLPPLVDFLKEGI